MAQSFSTSTKAAIDEKISRAKLGREVVLVVSALRVILSELALIKISFYSRAPPRKARKGCRESCIDNPSAAGLRGGLMQGRGTLVMSHDQPEQYGRFTQFSFFV